MISRARDFTVFAMISNKRKKIQEELRKEMGDKEYVIDTYGKKRKNIKQQKGACGGGGTG